MACVVTDDNLNYVLVSLVFTKVLEILLILIGNISSPLRDLIRLILRIIKFSCQDLLNVLLGLGRAELIFERMTDLVGLVTLCEFFGNLAIILNYKTLIEN